MSVDSQPSPVIRRGGYAELAAEIRRLGLLRPRPWFYAALLAVQLLATALAVAGLLMLRGSWWALLLAPAFAVLSTQFGFYGHDATHRQITRGERGSRLLGMFVGNLLNGLSYGWWMDKHNAHHAHPNDLDRDPDVHAGAIVFDQRQTVGRRRAAGWVTRHQAWLFFPMLTLESLNLHASSARAVLRPGLRHRWVEAGLLGAHYGAYVTLLAVALSWQQAIVFVSLHQALFGVYLGCSFAPGHKGMPVLSPEQAADPLLRQVLTSRNVRGGRVAEMLLGGLNYQIEHHLFPSMPRPNLHRGQRVVRRFCADRGVSYTEVSAAATYLAVLRHLDAVGAGLRHRDPH
ncbi:MAG: fatty acid desaturase family protein [Mycobacteriaceae bacterium]